MLNATHVTWEVTEANIHNFTRCVSDNLFLLIAKRELQEDTILLDVSGVIYKRQIKGVKGSLALQDFHISFGCLGYKGQALNIQVHPGINASPLVRHVTVPRSLGTRFTVYLLDEPLDLTMRGNSSTHCGFINALRNHERTWGVPWEGACPV